MCQSRGQSSTAFHHETTTSKRLSSPCLCFLLCMLGAAEQSHQDFSLSLPSATLIEPVIGSLRAGPRFKFRLTSWRHILANVLAISIIMMQGSQPGRASSRQAYIALDNVPTQNTRGQYPRPSRYPTLLDEADQPPAPYQRDKSCSPTPSEIDALEESFYDLGLEPSQADLESSQSSFSDMQTTTTVTQLSSRTASTLPMRLHLLETLSDLRCDSGRSRAMPLGDRLRLVWRMSSTLLACHV